MSKDDVLLIIKDMFTNAPRIGQEKDEPEGTRYIQISDTLANDLSDKISKVTR